MAHSRELYIGRRFGPDPRDRFFGRGRERICRNFFSFFLLLFIFSLHFISLFDAVTAAVAYRTQKVGPTQNGMIHLVRSTCNDLKRFPNLQVKIDHEKAHFHSVTQNTVSGVEIFMPSPFIHACHLCYKFPMTWPLTAPRPPRFHCPIRLICILERGAIIRSV